MSDHQDAQITRLTVALRGLIEAIDCIEDITWNRDLEPWKYEAIWEDELSRAKRVLKETT